MEYEYNDNCWLLSGKKNLDCFQFIKTMQSLDKGMSEEMHYLSYKIYLIRFRASFIEKRGEKLKRIFLPNTFSSSSSFYFCRGLHQPSKDKDWIS